MQLEDEVRAAGAKAAIAHYDSSEMDFAHAKEARKRQDLADQGL